MQPTLKEIAETAGVSIRSVTRALKNEAGGNEETCRRVRETARQLGYIPNIAARNLRIRRKNFIGLITSTVEITVMQRKTIAMQKRLEADGFYPVSALLPETPEQLREIILNWAGLVDKVVITTWQPDWNPETVLDGLPMQFIFVDCAPIQPARRFATVCIDRTFGIQCGIEYLIRTGRKKIAYCGSPMSDRLDGFRNAFIRMRRECAPDFFLETAMMDMSDGFNAGELLLQRNFDAVFFGTDRMALGFLKYCYVHTLAVPERMAVIGFDDDPASLYSCPSLSTVAQPIDAISVKIAELAAREDFVPVVETLPTQFVVRESV